MTFTEATASIDGLTLACSTGGAAADGKSLPLLFLHGYPQTRAMWHAIAPAFADHPLVLPDLPGYGASDKPRELAPYAFREMARRIVGLMEQLGHPRFAVIAHDRGARVAHRMALDHPDRVAAVTLMDIVPTHTLLSDLHRKVAQAYYHWFFLAQPAPLPERMIAADPRAYYETSLLGWGGTDVGAFAPDQLAAYRAAWSDPDTIRGMCNDYRAALSLDFDDDAADLGARIRCPAQVLYGADGVMARAYDVPATWEEKCTGLVSDAIPGGHFFPDTAPEATAQAVRAFLSTL